MAVTQTNGGGDEIDLGELVGALAARKWWIIASVVLFTGLAVAYTLIATPIFRANTILAPASQDSGLDIGSALGQLGGIAAMAGIGGSRGAETEEALAVLRSREFTERFIREHQLLPRLYPHLWDAQGAKWTVPQNEQPTYSRAYRMFHNRIRAVDQDKKTGLITLSIDWRNRVEAADWANLLIAQLNAEMRKRAMAKAVTSLGFLERELKATVAVETREAISRLMESQIKQRMLANVTEEYAFRVVDRALPPDADDPVKPRKLAIIAGGLFAGFFFGVAFALWRHWRRPAMAAAG
jgi:uncharacterized protein involved in exopolysaccharide biosynthesis